MFFNLLKTLMFVFWAALLGGCGVMNYGSGSPNDPVPSGTLVASGNFVGSEGKSVSGNVSIYQTSGYSYVMRLVEISTPAETGLQLIATVNGSQLSPVSLRAYTGTQNYSIELGGGATWQQVQLYSTYTSRAYGTATLISASR